MIRVMAKGAARAEILIYDPIGQDWYGNGTTAKRFRSDLEALGKIDEITVRINSPGGEVFDGFAIYNALKQHSAKVVVHIDGLAASIASVIAMAGDQVLMGEGAMFMVHSPWTIAMGNAENMRDVADMLDKVEVGLVDAYVAKTKAERKTVEKWMDGETWFTRDEAIAAGLADGIDGSAEDAGGATAAEWRKRVQSKRDATALFRRVAASLQSKAPASGERQGNPAASPPHNRGESQMNEEEIKAANEAALKKAREEAAQAAVAAEHARQAEIRALYAKFPQHRELLDAQLADPKVTAEAASKTLLAKLGEGAEPLNPAQKGHVAAGADARDKFLAGAGNAILVRAGLEKREAGNEFNGARLTDLAAHAFAAKGISVRGMSADQIARKVLNSHTQSDFPLLLANTAGKVLRSAYALAPVTWNRWCKKGSLSDFKIASRISLGSFSSLVTKGEREEYKQGTIGEEREQISLATKGRYISLSREMLVNDDLGGFVDMARKMGRAAARTVEADVYTLLTSASGAGPTMSDTGAFFNATAQTTAGGHGNLTSSGTAISVASIAAGEALMLAQKDKGLNDFLALSPRFLLCSPAKKQTAWEVVNSLTDVGQSNSAKRNYVQAQLNLEVLATPYLSGNPWYLFTDPADVEAFEVAFLDGQEEPFIDDEIEFMTDSMNMKVRLDYGVAAIDWRAGYRNAGA